MRLAALKPLRVAFSLTSFFLVLYLFVEGSGKLSHELSRGILVFQFVPSLASLFRLATAASLGFFLVLIFTLLFGRVYCSFLCPLGTLMDLVTGVRTRIGRKKRFRFMKPQPWVQYCLLAATVVPLFFGSLFVLGLLDPYSIAGRIFSDILRPAWYGMINFAAWGLKIFNNFSVYPREIKHVSVPSLLTTLVFFIAILLLAFFRGRWYCNAICPVGTVLGLVSRFSVFRIRINEKECISCGLCARACKAGCIDMKSRKVDFSRCVACYNCFRACENDGFFYSFTSKKAPRGQDPSRREFLKNTASGVTAAASVLVSGTLSAQDKTQPEAPKIGPITPPGSLSIWNFTSACTACHLCISACPTRVLQPSFFEYGLDGLFLPRMNNAVSFCNFDCIACTLVCPTEAIRPLTIEQKHIVQIGISKFIKNICVVVEKKTACGACSEHCPTKAVEMVPYLGTLKIPEIDEKLCVGCGACEYACPTRPIRAIYVEPNKYHRTAMKPLRQVNPDPEIKKTTEDFPF